MKKIRIKLSKESLKAVSTVMYMVNSNITKADKLKGIHTLANMENVYEAAKLLHASLHINQSSYTLLLSYNNIAIIHEIINWVLSSELLKNIKESDQILLNDIKDNMLEKALKV